MSYLRNFTINVRLWAILGLALGAILFLQIQNTVHQHQQLYAAKQESVRYVVDGVYSLIQYYHQREQQGMPRAEAQERALNAIRAIRYDDDEYFWINNSKADLIMHAANPSLDGRNMRDFQDPNGVYLFRAIVGTAQEHRSGGYVHYQWPKPGFDQPVDKISFVRLHQPWDWVLGSGVYTDDVEEAFKTILTRQIIGTLILIAIVAGAVIVTLKTISQPLLQLGDTMKNIAGGDANLTQRLPTNGRDELSYIAHHFNRFIEQLQGIINDVQQTTLRVTEHSEQIQNTSTATRRLTDDQRQQSEMAATGASEMSQTIQEVASHAQSASESANDADKNSRHGLKIMEETQQRIADLVTVIQSSQTVIQNLHSESDAIGSVLDVIRGIAEQTNLLALNAAIEAARAGEQGRGFAVVADEVRTLASRTQQSTAEIDNMITRLQQQAGNAVTAMEESVNNSRATSDMAEKAADAIRNISHAVATITDMNMNIASAVEQQSAVANEVTGNITHIADSSNTITDTMHEADQINKTLLQCSSELQQLVQRFRV